jgi:hypothetical protein
MRVHHCFIVSDDVTVVINFGWEVTLTLSVPANGCEGQSYDHAQLNDNEESHLRYCKHTDLLSTSSQSLPAAKRLHNVGRRSK